MKKSLTKLKKNREKRQRARERKRRKLSRLTMALLGLDFEEFWADLKIEELAREGIVEIGTRKVWLRGNGYKSGYLSQNKPPFRFFKYEHDLYWTREAWREMQKDGKETKGHA